MRIAVLVGLSMAVAVAPSYAQQPTTAPPAATEVPVDPAALAEADALLKARQWRDAADDYEAILARSPTSEGAAWGAVQAHAGIAKEFKPKKSRWSGPQDGPPQPQPLPPARRDLIDFCQKYIALPQPGPQLVKVKFVVARTYYDFDHLSEAAEVLREIAFEHSDAPLAVMAAQLHLDALNMLGDRAALRDAVVEYLEKRPIDDERLVTTLTELSTKLDFQACQQRAQSTAWDEAATCFVAFSQEHPDSELVAQALFNAAHAFEQTHEVGKAIQVRVMMLKLRPESELAPGAMYAAAGAYQMLAVYSEAAKFYELFARTWPKGATGPGCSGGCSAELAIANAASFREGLGQLEAAVLDYQKWLELYGKRDARRASEVELRVAVLLGKLGRHADVRKVYERLLNQAAGRRAQVVSVIAATRLGKLDEERGERKSAERNYKAALRSFQALSKAHQEESPRARDAAAEAKLRLLQWQLEPLLSNPVLPDPAATLDRRLIARAEEVRELEEQLVRVIVFRRPEWAIRALVDVGRAYESAFVALPKSPKDQESNAMVGRLRARALEAHKRAVEVSLSQRWWDSSVADAHQALARLEPGQHRPLSELRMQPVHQSSGLVRAAFLMTR